MKNVLTRYHLVLELCVSECERGGSAAESREDPVFPIEEPVWKMVEAYGTEVEPFVRLVNSLFASSMRSAKEVSCGAKTVSGVCGERDGTESGCCRTSEIMVELLELSARREGSLLESAEPLRSLEDEFCISVFPPLASALSLLIEACRPEKVVMEYTVIRGRRALLLSADGRWWHLQLMRKELVRGAVFPFSWRAGRRGRRIQLSLLF
jgi:hypothetical protein